MTAFEILNEDSMNYIKIFVASSVVEFEQERVALKAYISTLNDIYVRKGVYFELLLCEDLSNAMAKERKQAEYNAFIQDAQYFYILIGREAGEYTIEEFDVALKSFQAKGSPRIYTYFFTLPEGQSPGESTLQFIQRVDRELNHYYSTFTHIDAIKLNLLMEICRDPLAGGQLMLEDGKAVLDGKPILNVENVPLYSKNETIQKLLKEKQELEEEYAALMEMPDSEAVKRMRLANSNKRNEITEQLHSLEMDVLGLCLTVSEKRQFGKKLNWRERKALEYVDAGNYEAAAAILRGPVWREEVRKAEEITNLAADLIREYISGQRTLIQTLISTGITGLSAKEITDIYEEITNLAEKHQVELDVLYDYASFLHDQNQFPKGIQVAERLRCRYELDSSITEQEVSQLLNLIGNLYSKNRDFTAAEAMYRKALEICTRLAESNPGSYGPDVAMSCNNLASILKNTGRHQEAEELYRKALEIRTHLAKSNPESYEPDVALSCNNLASLLKKTDRPLEAEELYRKALEIRIRLAESNPGAYEPSVAMSCNNLASLLKHTGHCQEAEELYRKALEIRTRLAESNPGAYEPSVAMSCNNLASLLAATGRPQEAEELYRKALKIRTRLAQSNPGAYEPSVATTCKNLASLLAATGRQEEARTLRQTALEICKKYPHLAERGEQIRRYL